MILLIDVHNMAHRGAHSHRELWSKNSGQFTGLYYGMFNMLVKLVNDLKPEHVWLVSDPNDYSNKGCWRTQYLPDYKQRQKKRTPEEEKQYQAIQAQLPELRTALLQLNVFWFEQAKMEADDIIGHLRMMYADTPIICVSTDKDMFPLISPNFTIYYPGKPPRWLTHDNFYEQSAHFFKENKKLPADKQIKLTLDQWAEYRWLQGDKSDMIPGLPSCAEKRALMILREYGGYNNFCNLIHTKMSVGEKVTKTLEKLASENSQRVYALNAHLMRLNPPQGPDKLDMGNPLCAVGSANIDWIKQWMAWHEFSDSSGSLLSKLESSPLCRKLSSPYDKLPSY
jgi:DNA polymerase-1